MPWHADSAATNDDERLRKFQQQVENLSGTDLRDMVEQEGWDNILAKIGGNYEDLRRLQEEDPEGWEVFKEAQEKAKLNLERQRENQ